MEDNDRQLDVSRRQERRVRRANRSPDEQVGMLRSLVERASLTWKLLWDRRVGWLPKLIPALGLIYVVSPVDLLPELLVGALGPLIALDDIGVIMLVLNLFIQAAPPDVVREHLREMRGLRFEPDEAGGDYLDAYDAGDDGEIVDSSAEEVDW